MDTTTTDIAAPSTAEQTFEVPTDPQANLEWRKSGELPGAAKEAKPSKEDSAPSKTASAAPSKDGSAETAPASATGSQQEKKPEQRSDAAIRLNEILTDLKNAGWTPAELKTLKREAAAPALAAPEKTAQQPQGLEEPVEPQQSDKNEDGSPKYDSWEKLEAANKQYVKKLLAFEVQKAILEDRQLRADEARQRELDGKVADAETRYGPETKTIIGAAVRAFQAAKGVAPVVGEFMNESRVLPDVMYVLGSKAEELASFIELAKTDPGAALRKFTLLEQLVEQELAKGADKAADKTPRGEDGKFLPSESDAADKTPAKKKPAAPPPPDELNTRGSAPPDAKEAALRNNDFAAFKAIEDREDLARRRGA
jgi:hypothetical protein